MLTLIALVVFVLVALLVFAAGSFLDQRSAQARLLRDRLATVQKAEQQTSEELALLRDEMMSKIPALDSLAPPLRAHGQFPDLPRAGRSESSCRKHSASLRGQRRRGGRDWILGRRFAATQSGSRCSSWSESSWAATLPYSYASYRRTKRFQRFEELFPDAIDTLARAVRAGHAFTTALELIANEIAEPIASEFRKLFEEQKFGLPVRDALMNLTERVPLVDVKFFVTAVMLQRETGGNLAEILDNLSYVIRERFKIMRQVRVYTAQGRLTMMLLMGLPPIIVVVMLTTNPAFIRPLFADPIGHTLVVGGIVLQTIGYFVIRKIIQIQV